MKTLLILGAGTAGTIVANRLHRRLDRSEWRIQVVDRETQHLYQPGLLFVPFGTARPERLRRPSRQLLARGVELIRGDVDRVLPDRHAVLLASGRALSYDYLVIATGTSPRPDRTPGMAGPLWRHAVHDFYTYDGAVALREALAGFRRGRLVVHLTDLPIKCPVAPLEFTFLVDAELRRRGVRDDVDLRYVTPLPGAFTKPVAAGRLGGMLDERGIALDTDFLLESVDNDAAELVSYDERRIPFDLLVTVPLNVGADYVERSGLGDELNQVPVDRHTLVSRKDPAIFAIGDANDLPTSKAGSVAHFSAEVFAENFPWYVRGLRLPRSFDGHANCFVESGGGRALLLDFNYDTEPLPGRYPLPVVGPFSLLSETVVNHWGKLAFQSLYWHALLPGRPLPLPARMTAAGKRRIPEGV